MVLADVAPIQDTLLNYGFAGALLAVLFWFLRALVVHGVKPFVESAIASQRANTEALRDVGASSLKTTVLVEQVLDRLKAHMERDERTDAAILAALQRCGGVSQARAAQPFPPAEQRQRNP